MLVGKLLICVLIAPAVSREQDVAFDDVTSLLQVDLKSYSPASERSYSPASEGEEATWPGAHHHGWWKDHKGGNHGEWLAPYWDKGRQRWVPGRWATNADAAKKWASQTKTTYVVTSEVSEKLEAEKAAAMPPAPTAMFAECGMLAKGCVEFIAMALFVFIGCGTAMALPDQDGKLGQVSLAFGLAITVLAYTFGHCSGAQINCAVSLGLACIGHITFCQAIVNTLFQLAGSIVGSWFTMLVFTEKMDQTGGLGTNQVDSKFKWYQALVGEIMGTFLLVYVVCETAVDPATKASRSLAALSIGLAVFLAHSVLIPVDGCSINPTRSFGPMVMRKMFRPGTTAILANYDPAGDGLEHRMNTVGIEPYVWQFYVVFLVGPIIGALLGALVYMFMHQYDGWPHPF